MQTQCPHCASGLEISPQYIGQQAHCPDCSNEFIISNPNLQPCVDCFTMISKRAQACPHCGAIFRTAGSSRMEDDSLTAEETLHECHPSAVNYLPAIIFGVITIPILIGIFILLYAIICIKCTTYRITNKRIIAKYGLLNKTQKEIWIKDMRGAVMVQSFFQRLAGVGTIEIGTAATAGTEMQLQGIGQPQQLVDLINAQRHN